MAPKYQKNDIIIILYNKVEIVLFIKKPHKKIKGRIFSYIIKVLNYNNIKSLIQINSTGYLTKKFINKYYKETIKDPLIRELYK